MYPKPQTYVPGKKKNQGGFLLDIPDSTTTSPFVSLEKKGKVTTATKKSHHLLALQ